MEKVIRDGKVAVLYSTVFGLGWYTYHRKKQLLFHPYLVEVVEQGTFNTIKIDSLKKILEEEEFYYSASTIRDLDIEWVPAGWTFTVQEYGGRETIVLQEVYDWITA